MNAALLALRDADPAAGVDVASITPDWAAVSAAMVAADPAATPLEAPRPGPDRVRSLRPVRSRKLRVAVVGAVLVAAATVAGVVTWPGSSRPQSAAYGVSERDGLVLVRLSASHPMSAVQLQMRLQRMGVPSVVLNQSLPGQCSAPPPVGVPPAGQIVSFPASIGPGEGFAIRPAAIPSGDVLLVELPPADGPQLSGGTTYAGLFVTADPPSCVSGAPIGKSS